MALERRATSGFWYARFPVRGRRVCRRLDVKVEGSPGEPAFEASRKAAKALEAVLRGEAEQRDATWHRRVARALDEAVEEKTGLDESRPLDRLADAWLKLPKRRPPTDHYRAVVRGYGAKLAAWMAARGVHEVAGVSEGLAEAFMEEVRGEGIAASTYNIELMLFRGMFRTFGTEAGLRRNPFARLKYLPTETMHRVPFTREEIDRILETCGADIRGAVATAACTGMRRGDACRLAWDRVDLAGGFLRDVRVSKTGARVDVPILPMLRRYLEEAAGKRPAGRKAGFVWPEAARRANQSPVRLNQKLVQAMKRAGIEWLAPRARGRRAANLRGWHSLKTTFITEALNHGMPMEMLRKIVGNSTVNVVLKHYYQPGKAAMAAEMQRALGEFGK